MQSGAAYDLACPSTTLRVVPLTLRGRIAYGHNGSLAAAQIPFVSSEVETPIDVAPGLRGISTSSAG